MKNIILLFSLLITAFLFQSCNDLISITGEGPVVSKTFSYDDFDEIESLGSFNVEIIKGEEYKIEVKAQQNLIDILEVNKNNHRLEIGIKDSYNVTSDFDINFYITLPKIKKAIISGSGDMTLSKFETIEDLTLEINGSGNITTKNNIDIKNITSKINGAGKIKLLGTNKKQNIKISGSGDFNCFDFVSEEVIIVISGSGNCNVYAENKLNVSILGSGSIFYKGHPSIVKSISGSGSINDAN